MSKTKTKKAVDNDVEPDQGGGGADQDDGQDNDQDYAKARLLPGETKNYTKIPNPVLAEIEAILHHLKAGLYVLLEVYIRRHMGRTNKGAFKVGVIEGLTITRVAEILGCGHTTAARIRAKVVRDLGGVMVGDGIFRFGAAVTEGGSPGSGHGPVIGPQSGPANGLPNPLKMEMIGEGSGPQDGHVRGLANGCPRGPLEGIKLAQASGSPGPSRGSRCSSRRSRRKTLLLLLLPRGADRGPCG